MDIRFQTGGPSAWKAEAVLTFVFEGEGPDEACHVLEQAAPWLGIAPAWRDFKGKKRELATLYGPPAMDIPRVQAVGLGRREALTAVDLRYAVGGAVRLCREQGAAQNTGAHPKRYKPGAHRNRRKRQGTPPGSNRVDYTN